MASALAVVALAASFGWVSLKPRNPSSEPLVVWKTEEPKLLREAMRGGLTRGLGGSSDEQRPLAEGVPCGQLGESWFRAMPDLPSNGGARMRTFFRKLADPFCRVPAGEPLDPRTWVREVLFNPFPVYSFGLGGREGEIRVRLKEGVRLLRVLLPWFNTAVRSMDIGLHPFAAREFFDQMDVAFAKWKRIHSGDGPRAPAEGTGRGKVIPLRQAVGGP